MAEPKQLKRFNGRIFNHEHGYIAARSMADAVRVASEEYPDACITLTELRVYWHHGAWGNPMIGITPERGIWVENKDRQVYRVVKGKLLPVERGPEWAEFQAKRQAEHQEHEDKKAQEYQGKCNRIYKLAGDIKTGDGISNVRSLTDWLKFEYEGHEYEIKEKS